MSFRYPVTLDVTSRQCTVVGGGQVAERKVQGLLAAGAVVRVVAPAATPLLQELSREQKIAWSREEYQEGCLEGSFLVIAATGSREINSKIASDCRMRNIPVNVADSAEVSDFIVSSFLQRGDLIIAISTNGKSPALARKIKEELQESFGPEYGVLLDILGQAREDVLREVTGCGRRKELFYEMIDSILDLVREGRIGEARERVTQCLSQYLE